MKPLLTTTQVARICGVGNKSVIDWIDGGMMAGYRLPGSTHRRVPREAVVEFLNEHNLPVLVPEDPRNDGKK